MKYRNYDNNKNFLYLGIFLFIIFSGLRLILLLIPVLVTFAIMIGVLFVVYKLLKQIFDFKDLNSFTKSRNIDQTHFVELSIRILCHFAKADGKVDPREIETIRSFFQVNLGYDGIKMTWVNDLINYALNHPFTIQELSLEINSQFSYESKLILLQMLYRVGLADGHLSRPEEQFIESLVKLLAISKIDVDRISTFFIPNVNKIDVHYKRLGLTSKATKEEVRYAYKKLIKENHPDKVFHLGEDFRKIAEEKMQKINESYDFIMKQS